MTGDNAILDGGQELSYVAQQNPFLGTLIRKIIGAVNTTAKNASVSPVGNVSPPNPVDNVNVSGALSNNALTVNGEVLHLTLTHNQSVDKGIRYFTEVDTNPNFTQPHIHDHGTSRSAFIHLPTKDAAGNTHTYYIRSYAQYHGSNPTKPTVFGGLSGAYPITMGGSSRVDLLPSTGSGTASSGGQQGGKGLGTVTTRPGPQPKRSVSSGFSNVLKSTGIRI
jgi:hypothetical protein